MFFTIEPMINAGRWEVKILDDGWTAVTKDRSLSAQFEHTIGVTADGYEIFTLLARRPATGRPTPSDAAMPRAGRPDGRGRAPAMRRRSAGTGRRRTT